MRTRLISTLAAIMAANGCGTRTPARAPTPERDPIQSLLAGQNIIYGHLLPGDTTARAVDAGTLLGTVEAPPATESARHQDLLERARRLYDENRFIEAAAAIHPAFVDEPTNPFVMQEYGRALFRVDSLRPRSLEVYEGLVGLLDHQQDAAPHTLVVDMWFVDAYWKLALLYLDVREYRKAVVQLLRVAVAPTTLAGREQLFASFAEAFHHLGEQRTAEWFVDQALRMNPGNSYVPQFRRRSDH